MDRGRRCSSCPPNLESDPKKFKPWGEVHFPVGDDDECAICLDILNNWKEGDDEAGVELILLPCKHCFHKKCIFEWFISSKTCPVCRWKPNVVVIDDFEDF